MTGFHLSQYVPVSLYIAGIIILLITIFSRIETGIYFLIMLVPLQNVLKKLYDFPLGKDFIDMLIIAILIGWLLNKSLVKLESTSFNKPLLLVILYTYFSLWIGTFYFGDSIPITTDNSRLFTWKEYAEIFLLFWIAFNNIKTKKQMIICVLIITFSIIIVTYSYNSQFQWVKQYHFTGKMRSVSGTFSYLGPNHLGSFFSQYGMVLLGIFLYEKKLKVRNIILFGGLLWLFNTILYTYSRGAYIGTILAFSIVALLKDKRLLIIPVVLLLMWKSIVPQSVIDRIEMTTNEEGELDSSSQTRIELWHEAIGMVKKNPVTGVGFDTFKLGEHTDELKDTHNYYLKVLAEQGIIGLILLLYLFYLCFKSSIKLFRTSKDNFFKGLGLGGIGCIISIMTTNLFGDRWTFFMLTGYFWIFMALIERANKLNNKELSVVAEA